MPRKQRKFEFLVHLDHFSKYFKYFKIDHIADSLLKLQIKIIVHLINFELSQHFTLAGDIPLLNFDFLKSTVYLYFLQHMTFKNATLFNLMFQTTVCRE